MALNAVVWDALMTTSSCVHPAIQSAFPIRSPDLETRVLEPLENPFGPKNSLLSSPPPSARRRATNCSLSSMTEHSFQGIDFSPNKFHQRIPFINRILGS
jgi:hypothetical protein